MMCGFEFPAPSPFCDASSTKKKGTTTLHQQELMAPGDFRRSPGLSHRSAASSSSSSFALAARPDQVLDLELHLSPPSSSASKPTMGSKRKRSIPWMDEDQGTHIVYPSLDSGDGPRGRDLGLLCEAVMIMSDEAYEKHDNSGLMLLANAAWSESEKKKLEREASEECYIEKLERKRKGKQKVEEVEEENERRDKKRRSSMEMMGSARRSRNGIRINDQPSYDDDWSPNMDKAIKKRGKNKKAEVASNVDEPVRKKKKEPPEPGPATIERMLAAVRTVGGSDPLYLVSKGLTPSDMNRNQHRLLLPKPEVITSALEQKLNKEVEMPLVMDKTKGLPVCIVDGHGRTYHRDMKFKYLASNGDYRIIGRDFIPLLENNSNYWDPDVHDLHLWVFHVDREGESRATGGDGETTTRRQVWLAIVESEEEEKVEVEPVAALPIPPCWKVHGVRGRSGKQ